MNLSLAQAIFWIAALACAVAQVALLRSSMSTPSQPQSNLVPASPRRVELAWSILPAVVLVVLIFTTWKKIRSGEGDSHTNHVVSAALGARVLRPQSTGS